MELYSAVVQNMGERSVTPLEFFKFFIQNLFRDKNNIIY